jgi:hypothetical protein
MPLEVMLLSCETTSTEVREYLPELSEHLSIEVLYRGRPWVRKHSVLFEISVF